MRFGGATESLITISSQLEYGPTLTLTVKNVWPGEITTIESLTITAPPGIIIQDIDGETGLQCTGCGTQQCECTVPPSIMKRLLEQEPVSAGLRLFNIHTRISDPAALMPQDLNIRNFKATAHYTYKNKEVFGVTIKPATSTAPSELVPEA